MLFILKERKGHHKEADQAANLGLGVGTVPSTQAHKVTRIKMSQEWWPQGYSAREHCYLRSAMLTLGKQETERKSMLFAKA